MTSNRTLTLLLASVACALVLLTACGGGSDSTPTPSPTVRPTIDPNATLTARPTRTPAASSAPDPCALIPTAGVVTLIGALAGVTPSAGGCTYSGASGQLIIQLEKEASVDAAAQKVTASASGAESVDAGDAAFFSGGRLFGHKGLYYFSMTTTVQEDNLKDALTPLAQSAAATLPAS